MWRSFINILETIVFGDNCYTIDLDLGYGEKVARIIRAYAKNITDKQVEELNEYINEEE